MKTFLIAAGLMAAMFGGAPAAIAAPVSGYAPSIEAPQSRDDRREDDGGESFVIHAGHDARRRPASG